MPVCSDRRSSFEIDKQLVQILNALYARMIERLVIRTVRHEYNCACVFCDIAAVLMSIIDEQLDIQFSDEFRLLALGEINRRIGDPVFSEPAAGNLADVVGLPFVTVSDENQLLFAAELVQRLPLFC